jgi:hypothetical protein
MCLLITFEECPLQGAKADYMQAIDNVNPIFLTFCLGEAGLLWPDRASLASTQPIKEDSGNAQSHCRSHQ